MEQKEQTKKLINGFCDPECEFLLVRDMPSYTSKTGKEKVNLCTFGGTERSYGCMNCCPKNK